MRGKKKKAARVSIDIENPIRLTRHANDTLCLFLFFSVLYEDLGDGCNSSNTLIPDEVVGFCGRRRC